MGGMVRMGGIAAAPPPERVADRGDRTFAKGERQPHTLTPSNQPCNPPPPPRRRVALTTRPMARPSDAWS